MEAGKPYGLAGFQRRGEQLVEGFFGCRLARRISGGSTAVLRSRQPPP
jgi:hypothetical protein